MRRFLTYNSNIRDAFNNSPEEYDGFIKLFRDLRKGVFQGNISSSDANEKINEKFYAMMGIDKDTDKRMMRNIIDENQRVLFNVTTDIIDDLLTTGWGENPFYKDWVETRNLALYDQNEFITPDKTVLTVGKHEGNNWSLHRQRLGAQESYRVPTSWVGLAVYDEYEKILTGRADWAQLVSKLYEAMDDYVNDLVYQAVMSAGQQILPPTERFYKTAVLDATTQEAFNTMIEDVQGVNRGSEVVIMGTKNALSKLNRLVPIDWVAKEDRTDNRNMGHIGIYLGTRVVEIPQVFKKNDINTKLVNPNMLMIMPLADNKFVKLVYEGTSRLKEVTSMEAHQDMTYDLMYMTKLGVGVQIGRYFGTWNIVQGS